MPVHIKATKENVAPLALITGDPTRAKYIADNFLSEVTCYSNVRLEPGFTGLHEGKRVSVQSAGMGMPSQRIYMNELVQLGVKKMIRIGTCGAFQPDMHIGELVIAQGGCSDSAMNLHRFGLANLFAPVPDWQMMYAAYSAAMELDVRFHVGNILSSDSFYPDTQPPGWVKPPTWELWAHYGVLGVEMETAELYTLGKELKFKALTLLTISDHLRTEEKALSAEERTTAPKAMVELALDII